jgi:hypothetical protein
MGADGRRFMIAISGAKVRFLAPRPYFCARNRDHDGRAGRCPGIRKIDPNRQSDLMINAHQNAIPGLKIASWRALIMKVESRAA